MADSTHLTLEGLRNGMRVPVHRRKGLLTNVTFDQLLELPLSFVVRAMLDHLHRQANLDILFLVWGCTCGQRTLHEVHESGAGFGGLCICTW